MKNLLLTSVLAVSFLVPGISFADDNIFGVQVPVKVQVVDSNVTAGSYIAKDSSLVDTLVPQKIVNGKSVSRNNSEEKDAFYVFGVNIKAGNLI